MEYIILCRVVVSVHEYGFLFIRQVRVAVQNISHIRGMIRACALEFRFICRYVRLKPHIIACIYLALDLIVPRLTRLFAHGRNEQVIRKGLLLAVRQAAVLPDSIQYHTACLVRRVQLLAVFVRALGQFLQRIVILGKRAYCKTGVCRLVSRALHLLAYLGADFERSPVGVIRSRAAHCINDDLAVDGGFLALRQLVVLKQHAALFLAFVVEKLTVLIRVGLHIMQRHDRIVNVFACFLVVVCSLCKRIEHLGLIRVQGFIAALAPCAGLIAGTLAEQQRL